jgi:bacterioferritin
MDEQAKKPYLDKDRLLTKLNQALRLEYSLIIHYPRLAQLVQDKEAKKLIQELGIASINHADVVASLIGKWGGKPDWGFELFPDDKEVPEILQIQLTREKAALKLHQESAELLPADPDGSSMETLAKEEEAHIHTVNRILSRLKQ